MCSVDSRLLSVLAYPGGKTRALKQLRDIQERHFPGTNLLYSPFHGGMSFELDCASRGMEVKANDLDPWVSGFWQALQQDRSSGENLIEKAMLAEPRPVSLARIHAMRDELTDQFETLTPVQRAVNFLYLNKTSYSGQVRKNYTQKKFEQAEVTLRAGYLDRCGDLRQFTFTNEDAFQWLLAIPATEGALVYADPPYLLRTGSDHLYLGHKGFDHEALHDVMQAVKVPWMLSYKDHPEIRRLYAGHIIETVKFPYTTSPGQAGEKREKVSELLILSKRL